MTHLCKRLGAEERYQYRYIGILVVAALSIIVTGSAEVFTQVSNAQVHCDQEPFANIMRDSVPNWVSIMCTV